MVVSIIKISKYFNLKFENTLEFYGENRFTDNALSQLFFTYFIEKSKLKNTFKINEINYWCKLTSNLQNINYLKICLFISMSCI